MTSTPVSLYLDLERGQQADLEVVANASLAFAAAIRDIAYVLDPSIEIRVEFTSGTKGSLHLNSRIKVVAEKATDPKVLGAIALAVLGYFRTEITDFAVHKVLDGIYDSINAQSKPTSHEVKEVKNKATNAVKKRVGEQHVQQVFRAIERDPVIMGVGATSEAAARPEEIIPRQNFPARAGYTAPVEISIKRRERPSREALTIVKPVLEVKKRKWRFRGLEGEFGAEIDDDRFLADTLSGRHPIPMIEGVQLDVTMVTIEEFDEGVWRIVDHRIVQVHGYKRPPKQTPLPFTRSRPIDRDDDDDEE